MSKGVPPKLDPATLYSEQEKRDELRLKTYNNILEQVHNKIRIIAKMPKNDKTLLFTVPEFVIGVPRFNTRDCILYLAWNLRNSNFDVQYYQPNLLWISWQKHEQQYKDERSPIVQTMKNAIEAPKLQITEERNIKPTIKKTTQQYITPQSDTTKKVTFI
jgi:hypothetical protein